jgi:hypothetical protein
MADVEDFYVFLLLQDAEYDAIDVRLAAEQQVPEPILLPNDGAAIWVLFQA